MDLTPEKSPIDPQVLDRARHELGRQLARWRKRSRINQTELARRLGYSRSTIANLEVGRQNVPESVWAACDQVLNAEGELLRAYTLMRDVARTQEVAALGAVRLRSQAPAGQQTASVTLHASEAATDTEPASTSARAPEALLEGIADLAVAAGITGKNAHERRPRLGGSDVLRLTAITQLYRSLDVESGGGVLAVSIGTFAEAASALLDHPTSEQVRPALMTAVAGARQLAGWTVFDAGLHSQAQRHWLSAERTAVAAGDIRLATKIRYCQAKQFQHLRHNRDALETLRLAREHLGVSTTPAIAAMLWGAEASSLAALGDSTAALKALDSAQAAFDRIAASKEPDWMRFFDEAELLAQYGRVYRDFARADRARAPAAVTWVSHAVEAFGTHQVRSTVLNEIGLCSALFLAGQREDAIDVGERMITRAATLTSARVVDRIRNLRRDMKDHHRHPAAKEFAAIVGHFEVTRSDG